MVTRSQSLPKIHEIENKMNELRKILESKRPQMSQDEIEELVVFLINQHYL